jgi:pimeloyl-ACP methyl ester carboxylesterase
MELSVDIELSAFRVHIAPAVIDELRQRIATTRWPDEVEGARWAYGTSLVYLRELASYWHDHFDWAAQERMLNRFAHFHARVGGRRIHLIHARAACDPGIPPLPIILTHGWPGTFFELLKLIPRLADPSGFGADPADAFDVVVPSLPGYGFSDRPLHPGPWSTHELWAELMAGLGYERFAAYGSDFGAGVTTDLAWRYPDRVVGICVTTASDIAAPYPPPASHELSDAERDFLMRQVAWDEEEGGYRHQQRTRPQSLAYGLNDSPVGLAAWIVEKLRAWSDCAGDVERRFTKDEMLTLITLYWATQTIGSSMRDYYERRHYPEFWRQAHYVSAPTLALMFPRDFRFPREWVERSYNLRRWAEMDHGGHFPAHEEPDAVAAELRAFFRDLR